LIFYPSFKNLLVVAIYDNTLRPQINHQEIYYEQIFHNLHREAPAVGFPGRHLTVAFDVHCLTNEILRWQSNLSEDYRPSAWRFVFVVCGLYNLDCRAAKMETPGNDLESFIGKLRTLWDFLY
jgi:hypothetical protein